MPATVNHINNTFRKAERLHSRKLIDLLFSEGKKCNHSCVRCVYLFTDEKLEAPVQAMFSAPKKIFKKAVSRNLIKRRMREVYRLNKSELSQSLVEGEQHLMIAFLYGSDQIESYASMEVAIRDILHRLVLTSKKQIG